MLETRFTLLESQFIRVLNFQKSAWKPLAPGSLLRSSLAPIPLEIFQPFNAPSPWKFRCPSVSLFQAFR